MKKNIHIEPSHNERVQLYAKTVKKFDLSPN